MGNCFTHSAVEKRVLSQARRKANERQEAKPGGAGGARIKAGGGLEKTGKPGNQKTGKLKVEKEKSEREGENQTVEREGAKVGKERSERGNQNVEKPIKIAVVDGGKEREGAQVGIEGWDFSFQKPRDSLRRE